MKRIYPVLSLFFLFTVAACKNYYTPSKVNWQDYKVTPQSPQDAELNSFLKPYRDSINATMNTVIAQVGETLEKDQPENPLGNVLVDAMLATAQTKFGMKVDAAFINHGGIRLPVLAAGPLTNGKVFELMPFDNLIVLQQLTGKQFKEFLNHIARKGGWPPAGLTYDIQNDMAVNIKVGGIPFNEEATYMVCNSDFIANGGDDCAMLRPVKQINKYILMRDSFIEYFKAMNAQGKKIMAPPGIRVRKIS